MSDEVDDPDRTWLSPAETKFRRAVRAQNRFVNFFAILGVPAVVGIWLSVANRENVGVWPFWIVLALLIALQVVLYFVATLYAETVPELHLEKTELGELQQLMAEDITASDDHIRWLEAANTLASYWSTFQGLITHLNPIDDKRFAEACRIAVGPMVDAAGTLFDFDYGEVWSVAVYRLDATGESLDAVWWQRPADHPSQGTPRSWRPGDGHVGSAFMQDRILFTTDMTSDEAAMLLKPSVANDRPYDADVYRSFVSAPILLDVEPGPLRFGVLVITSNVAGRFNDDNKSIVAHAAQVLAHLFYWRKLADDGREA
ncbi:MAG TPA: GAF domain-containing protein [Allosphingosinicella sp.]|nr:GAF domain-containing protein [Allosphingosinicella sp.]